MDYSITAEVTLHNEDESSDEATGTVTAATVTVEGHNLSGDLAEGIARHYVAVELGTDVAEIAYLETLALEFHDGYTTVNLGTN